MLSRNELYAPLAAYEQTDVDPSSYMINQASTPKTMKESLLVSFLQGISQDYHREEALSSDPKNNGSRPTSLTDVESKIKQRAVAIIGGKATATMTSMSSVVTKNRKRKQRVRSWKDVQDIVKLQSRTVFSMPPRLGSTEFLRDLNDKWNQYIQLALKLATNAGNPSAVMSRFAALKNDLELVGAHVRVTKCTQRKGVNHRYGVLLGEKKNTWMMATSKSERKRKKMRSSSSENLGVENDQYVDMVMVPKRGTTLTLIVSLPTDEVLNHDESGIDVDADDSDIIRFSQKSICIVVKR